MSTNKQRFCGSNAHSLDRRSFLCSAAGSIGGVAGVHYLGQEALAEQLKRNDKRVILLWLAGGASQLETWDPKPGRPTGGPFTDIATSVPGVRISELMPKMAQRFGKSTSVVRSLNTKNGSHGGGAQLMMRGRNDEPSVKYPDFGAMLAREIGDPNSQVPDYVAVYTSTEGRGSGRITPAFLGARFAPIQLTTKMGLGNVEMLKDISNSDHVQRSALRSALSNKFTKGRDSSVVDSHRQAYDRVRGLMKSDKLFDISSEPKHILNKYGPTQFAQQVLVARRLIEAGVPFVRVGRAWWDSHGQNFETHQELVPELDHVMSTLLDDLTDRGLLDHTLVITLAEFGRTPKINGSLGRDHFASAWSASLSGCGIKPGVAYGRTDKDGQTVADGQVGAGEIVASVFEAVGIPHDKEYHIGSRPIPLVNPGISPIKDILA
jgi:hypothetical protein